MGLEDNPFDFRVTKDGRVLISRGGRQVTVVAGPAADKLISKLGQSDDEDQQLLARITGNYRRGNEKPANRRT
ncbi:hypothetical protein [Microlunatus speluncae]|uniref:hypothetical protein n=1 Tax=Microlunatus speluncae TaxID=2594267 RepID=UPI0012666240|nr:hypothetical protein [Microlunatus speluncae]